MQQLAGQEVIDIQFIFIAFIGGLLIFGLCLFLLMVMFGWSATKIFRNTTLMGSLLLLTIGVPVTGFLVSQQTNIFTKANEKVEVFNLSVNRLNDQTIALGYNTSLPVISYLEVKLASGTIQPVFPEYELKEMVYHTFILSTEESPERVYIIINGKRYPLKDEFITLPL